jgi:hypothetical protein
VRVSLGSALAIDQQVRDDDLFTPRTAFSAAISTLCATTPFSSFCWTLAPFAVGFVLAIVILFMAN